MKSLEKVDEPEYLNLWLAEIVQFLPIRRYTLGTLIHSAKRQVSSLFAICNRTCRSCEDPNGGLYCNRRQDCAAEECSATLVEIADELGDPPFGELIAFSVLPLAYSHSGSLGGTVLLRGTDHRHCSFPRLLIHFLEGFAYWNEGWSMSFRRLAKLNSTMRRIPFLVLLNPICSVLHLSVHASTKTSNS
uniref:Uncharacterized protein n=1 Tax=Solanum tuberosum TaxID=4113 RepID=M1DJW1_SOLTU